MGISVRGLVAPIGVPVGAPALLLVLIGFPLPFLFVNRIGDQIVLRILSEHEGVREHKGQGCHLLHIVVHGLPWLGSIF